MQAKTLCIGLLLALAQGCASGAPKGPIIDEASSQRIRLRDLVQFFSNRVERAADDIAQQEQDPSIDRNTVYWKLRVIPYAQSALLRADDQGVVLQLWLVSAVMVEVFGQAGSADLFGDSAHLAEQAAKEIVDAVRVTAGSLLTAEQVKQSEQLLVQIVDTHVGMDGLQLSPEEREDWGKQVSSILKKPLNVLRAPFSSLDPTQGLSDTALAMHRFTDQFGMARRKMGYMPRELRWQLQLLLMEIDESINLSSMADAVAEIGASADSLAATAKTLPADLRTELSSLAKDLDESQPEVQTTLREANTTLTSAEATAAALNTMSATMTETFHAFTEVVESFESDPDEPAPATPPDPADESPPYDINDYGRTAEKVTATAKALTVLLDEVEELAEAKEPPAVLVETEEAARALVHRFFLLAAAFVLFTALVAYGYRVAVARRTG
jgi:hypothetical protein